MKEFKILPRRTGGAKKRITIIITLAISFLLVKNYSTKMLAMLAFLLSIIREKLWIFGLPFLSLSPFLSPFPSPFHISLSFPLFVCLSYSFPFPSSFISSPLCLSFLLARLLYPYRSTSTSLFLSPFNDPYFTPLSPCIIYTQRGEEREGGRGKGNNRKNKKN